MKLEDMTIKQVKEYCVKTDCKKCEIEEICGSSAPCKWDIEGEVQGES